MIKVRLSYFNSVKKGLYNRGFFAFKMFKNATDLKLKFP
jgi:hypothetical protein